MISILLLIQNTSSLFFQDLEDRSKYTNYNWYYRHRHLPQLFQLLGKVQVLVHLFASFHFLVHWNCKIQQIVIFLLINTTYDLRDSVIHLDFKVTMDFTGLLFKERFWFVHILFVSMFEFQSLAQLPVDQLSRPIWFCISYLLSVFDGWGPISCHSFSFVFFMLTFFSKKNRRFAPTQSYCKDSFSPF